MDVSEPNQITKELKKEAREERLAYSIPEAADMLGLDYFSVYRLVQRGKLKACRALRGKFLVTRAELNRLLNTEE
ncbi:MAG: helix-turn-helix domain-containing protein [Limisphaerales bacterium]